MRNQHPVILSAALATIFAAGPLAVPANSPRVQPVAGKSGTEKSALAKQSSPKPPLTLKEKIAAQEAYYAKIGADISKQEVIKQKKFDQVYAAAQAAMAASNLTEAETKFLEAVDIAESLNGNEQKLLTRTRLADCYLKQKKYKEAERQYKESYDTNIQLYRGNYPVLFDDAKGLSEVYKATGRGKESEAIVTAAKEARKTRYSVAGVDDGDLFATFYQSLRESLGKKNDTAVSKLVQYPLTVRWNGKLQRSRSVRTYRNEKELLANYKIIFTPAVLELFASTPEKDLWCRDQGIMLGGGLVWLTSVPLVKVAPKPTYQINAITINDDMPTK